MTHPPIQSSIKQKAIANGYLLVQTMMWGFSFLVTKNLITTLPAAAYTALRFLIATLALLPFYVGKLRSAMSPAFLRAALFLGALTGVSSALQTFGLLYTTVTNSAFITGTTVLLVPLFEKLIFKRKLPGVLWLGCAAAFSGVAVLAGNASFSVNPGDIMTMLCAVGFSLHMIFTARYARRFSADTLGVAHLAVASLLLAVLWGADGFHLPAFEARFIAPLLFMAIINTSVGFVGQFMAYRYTEATVASLIFAMEPIFAMGFALVIPGEDGTRETLSLQTALGALLVLAGVALALWNSFRQKQPPAADDGAACEAAE